MANVYAIFRRKMLMLGERWPRLEEERPAFPGARLCPQCGNWYTPAITDPYCSYSCKGKAG